MQINWNTLSLQAVINEFNENLYHKPSPFFIS